MYIDDPTSLIEPVEAAWEDYVANSDQWFSEAESRVTQWRFAIDYRFLPEHPLAHLFYVGDHSPWQPRPIRYVEEDTNALQVRHGLDADGRVIMAGNRVVIYGDGYHDILFWNKERDREKDELTGKTLLYVPHYRAGFPTGRVTRYFTDPQGRIVQSLMVANEGEEPELHWRCPETFHWEDGRLIESFSQMFNCATEPDEDDRDLAPEVLATLDREVNANLRETMYSRTQTVYSYDEAGIVTKVAEFKEDGTPGEVRYTYNPDDTLEKLSAELVKLLHKQLVKAINAVKEARPIRYVALQYSAEHAHCGLPTEVLIASADDQTDPLDWESYQHSANWPPESRTGQKYEDLQRRLQLVVEGSAEFADDFQPRPYREVLWRASRLVYDALSRKRTTTDDFAILPIDDHGDVDPHEDIRESLPDNIAQQLISK